MEIEYAPRIKFLVNNFLMFSYFFSFIPFNIFRKIYVVLYQENIRRLCDKIYSQIKKYQN